MAKTLNEVLATARKNLPTADDNRELLVQTLVHLKSVKDSAPTIYPIQAKTDMDELAAKLKVGDIITIEDYRDCIYVAKIDIDNNSLIVLWLTDTKVYYGFIEWNEDEIWDDIIDETKELAYKEDAGTKLYKHEIVGSIGSGGSLFLDLIMTTSTKVESSLSTDDIISIMPTSHVRYQGNKRCIIAFGDDSGSNKTLITINTSGTIQDFTLEFDYITDDTVTPL